MDIELPEIATGGYVSKKGLTIIENEPIIPASRVNPDNNVITIHVHGNIVSEAELLEELDKRISEALQTNIR